MSAHRDLVNAQQALNEAVDTMLTRFAESRYSERFIDALQDVNGCFLALRNQQSRLDVPGGAAHRFTSINAANANLPAKESLRRNIVVCVVAQWEQFHTGMTVAELKGRLRKEHSSVSSAINGLMNRGWIKDSGETRLTQHGQPAIVWVPTDLAIEKVRAVALEVASGS